MDILQNILVAIATAFVTTLVLNFFLNRMTENAKKPWMTKNHEIIVQKLLSPNAFAMVLVPDGKGQNLEVYVNGQREFVLPEQLAAFEDMVEFNLVIPFDLPFKIRMAFVGAAKELDNPPIYRLSRNYASKFRKTFWRLVLDEFGIARAFEKLRGSGKG